MNSDQSYTLSQVLGKYYHDESEQPILHNLTYLNRIWNIGDQERYIVQECTTPVTRKEFLRWFEKSDPFRTVVFVYHPFDVDTKLTVTTGELYFSDYKFKMYSGSKLSGSFGLSEIVGHISPENKEKIFYTKEESVNMFQTALLTNDELWYGDRNKYTVTFDVATLYSTLTLRGKCAQIIKNYTRTFVLKVFDNFVDKFQTLLFSYLRVYIYGNAFALNIDYIGDIDELVSPIADLKNVKIMVLLLIDEIREIISRLG
jgi:hypothetical protein